MENTLIGLQTLIKKSYQDLNNKSESVRDKHNAIAIIQSCYQQRLEILGSGVLASELNKEDNKDKDTNKAITEEQAEEEIELAEEETATTTAEEEEDSSNAEP